MAPEPGIERIVVLRANGIGDYVFALPALDALRATYPAAHITLLGLNWHRRFLAGRCGPIDEVRVLPAPPEDPACADAPVWAEEAERGCDLAVQLHGGGRHSNPLVAQLGARLSIGARTLDAAPLDRWVTYRVRHHEVLRWLEVVALAGAVAPLRPPRLVVTAADRDAAAAALGVAPPGAPLVAVCPGAGDPRRRWPATALGTVAGALAEAGAVVVVTGDDGDAPLAAEVVEASGGRALDLSGRLDLGGLTGLLVRCDVVVGNDTGPLHLAAAVGAATVGIYWGPNAVHARPVRGDRHAAAIAWDPRCPVCGVDLADLDGPGCAHDASLVAPVPVAEVQALALELLARAPRPLP